MSSSKFYTIFNIFNICSLRFGFRYFPKCEYNVSFGITFADYVYYCKTLFAKFVGKSCKKAYEINNKRVYSIYKKHPSK